MTGSGTAPIERAAFVTIVELDVAVLDPDDHVLAAARASRRMRSATVTERWRPPVQPTAIVRWLLPSAT